MRLIIGGAYEGKRAYVQSHYGIRPEDFTDAGAADFCPTFAHPCVFRYHLYIKALCEKQEDALKKTEQLLECNPDVILIMDEVGSGIIPMEKSERQWREAVGRVSCFLARRAESVERIVCGCGVKIK